MSLFFGDGEFGPGELFLDRGEAGEQGVAVGRHQARSRRAIPRDPRSGR